MADSEEAQRVGELAEGATAPIGQELDSAWAKS